MIRFQDDLSDQPVLELTGTDLGIDDVVSVARHRRRVRISPAARARMGRCRAMIDVLLEQEVKVYGLTTGFGKLRDVVIRPEETVLLQENLIRSHACGLGRPFSEEVVRAALLLRINTLCRGNSGIRTQVVEQLVGMLNSDIYPYVPEQGSVGASGDLSPLSHLGLVLLGDPNGAFMPWKGTAKDPRPLRSAGSFADFQPMPATADWERVAGQQGWAFQPVRLAAKEGLALNNGTQFMTALACLAVYDSYFALHHAELAAAMSLEGNYGVRGAFDPRVHAVRPQPHQPDVARRIREYGEESEILGLWLNSAALQTAVLKLGDARHHLDELQARLDREAVPVPARLEQVKGAIEDLAKRIRALTPRPGEPGRERLEQLGNLPARAQIRALNEQLARPRQDATSILRELQGITFPHGEERDQARSSVVAVVEALEKAVPDTPPVQDDYSFRCMPQVAACAHHTLEHVVRVVEVEINAATDNPLLFPPDPAEDGGPSLEEMSVEDYAAWLRAEPSRAELCASAVVGGGNFHGEPIAIAMDFLKIAMAEVANISERRIAHLTDPNHSGGLPAFLVKKSGVNSGFMIPQYSAASLVSENKVLCHPASVDSVPTCGNTEDHVSMGTIAARKAAEVVENVQNVIAIELLTANQALHFREPLRPGERLRAVLAWLADPERGGIPRVEDDLVFHPLFLRMRRIMDRPDFRALLLH